MCHLKRRSRWRIITRARRSDMVLIRFLLLLLSSCVQIICSCDITCPLSAQTYPVAPMRIQRVLMDSAAPRQQCIAEETILNRNVASIQGPLIWRLLIRVQSKADVGDAFSPKTDKCFGFDWLPWLLRNIVPWRGHLGLSQSFFIPSSLPMLLMGNVSLRVTKQWVVIQEKNANKSWEIPEIVHMEKCKLPLPWSADGTLHHHSIVCVCVQVVTYCTAAVVGIGLPGQKKRWISISGVNQKI